MNVKNHADNMQTRQTDELQWMTSQMSHTKQLYKSVAQINHTRREDVTAENGKSWTVLLDVPEQLRCLWRHLRLLI